MEKKYAIGVDIGGSHILSAAVDLSNNTLILDSKSYEKVDNTASLEEIMTAWSTALNHTMTKIDRDQLLGIGFAMPGAFNYKDGIGKFEESNKKYLALTDVHIETALRPYLKLDQEIRFRFLNDASSFAVGEAWVGRSRNATKSIAITLGTGLGSAFIDEGLPIVNRGDVPKEGCLWYLPFKEALVDDYFSTRWFTNACDQRYGKLVGGVRELAEGARSTGEYMELFDEFGTNLAEMFTPWLRKFPADTIVMGGAISGAFDLFGPAMLSYFKDQEISTQVEVSELMEEAALFGSVRMLDDHFWNQVKDDLPRL